MTYMAGIARNARAGSLRQRIRREAARNMTMLSDHANDCTRGTRVAERGGDISGVWRVGGGARLQLFVCDPVSLGIANGSYERAELRRGVIVVASEWMKRRVEEPGMAAHLECRVIPFGVDTTVFRPRDPAEIRSALGIDADAHVVAFRDRGPGQKFKNSALVVEALRRYRPTRRTYVLCLESSQTARRLAGQYEVVDLGWVPSVEEAAVAYSAADLFLMPSRPEAFGMMAVEAMACGVPVVVADGTSLPGVVKAPDVGVSVHHGDPEALAAAIESLLADPVARRRRGHAGRELAEREYSLKRYFKAPLQQIAGRWGRPVSSLARPSILCEGIASIRDNGSCRLRCVLAGDLTNAHKETASVCLSTSECNR